MDIMDTVQVTTTTGQPITDPTPITAGRIGGTAIGTATTGKGQKARNLFPGFFLGGQAGLNRLLTTRTAVARARGVIFRCGERFSVS